MPRRVSAGEAREDMGRARSYVAAEAIRAYVDLSNAYWGINAALERGRCKGFASEKEVQKVLRKWSAA
jgi:predicted transcriptional regulator